MELKLPEWASAPPPGFPGAIEPSTGAKEEGFDNGEEPPAGYFNWAFQALADLQNEVGNAITGTGGALDGSLLTQLLGALQRQNVKNALSCVKRADDTNAGVTLRALAVKPSSKIVVAVGDTGAITRADLYDTHDFASQTPGSSFVGNFNDILCNGNIFVAVGEGGEIQTSSDGITWLMQSTTGTTLRAVTWSGSVYIAVGEAGHIRRSTTGGVWAAQTNPFAGTPDITGVAYGAGVFVIATNQGDLASSTDGFTWTVRKALAATVHDPARIAYHETLGFLYHYGDDVYRSPDGVTWTRIWNNVQIFAQSDTPGLLVAPYCWALGLSGTVGTSCEGRASVTAINAPASFTVSYVTDEPLTWWKFIDGQLWALGGDKVFVGGVV